MDWIRFSVIPNFLILSNSIPWLTVSNADLRSIKSVHVSFSSPLLYLFYISSTSLRIFISQPIPFLNPVYPSFRIQCPLLCNCLTRSSLNTVSISLYIGDVLVMGLELVNVFQSLSSFGMYIC